jgi:GT2 family glycosyltransferase
VALLEYPDFEVIVVDDGSTDATAAIAQEYANIRLVQTENRGLSAARNLGAEMATGEIVAYLDADAWPDPHWLHYLVATFETGSDACVGGPNLPPPRDGFVAESVAQGPGGPNHVLLSDREAEHVPGCNMAFRRAALHEIGGFDPVFRVAGDDVDMCWRIREQGGTIAFSPGAVVWHHRRKSLAAYWKQQVGYGHAEALLETKWPEKYNGAGHVSWGGRVYGGVRRRIGRASRVYHGVFGTAAFQSMETPAPSVVSVLHLVPEWWYVVAVLTILSVLGLMWTPLLVALPLLCVALAPLIGGAVVAARSASVCTRSRTSRAGLRALTALVHVIHPVARLWGRLRVGLTPWRRRPLRSVSPSRPSRWTDALWSERPRAPEAWIGDVEAELKVRGGVVRRGDVYASWDLEVRHGRLGRLELLVAVEEHGGGNQLVRFRAQPRLSRSATVLALLAGSLALWAFADHVWGVVAVLGAAAVLLTARTIGDCALAAGAVRSALRTMKGRVEGAAG